MAAFLVCSEKRKASTSPRWIRRGEEKGRQKGRQMEVIAHVKLGGGTTLKIGGVKLIKSRGGVKNKRGIIEPRVLGIQIREQGGERVALTSDHPLSQIERQRSEKETGRDSMAGGKDLREKKRKPTSARGRGDRRRGFVGQNGGGLSEKRERRKKNNMISTDGQEKGGGVNPC